MRAFGFDTLIQSIADVTSTKGADFAKSASSPPTFNSRIYNNAAT
jgi:hypothetical protein